MSEENKEKYSFLSGYLLKKSLSYGDIYHVRFFSILDGKFLAYYLRNNQKTIMGIFDIETIENISSHGLNRYTYNYCYLIPYKLSLFLAKKISLSFKFDYINKTLEFKVLKPEDVKNWVEALNHLKADLKKNYFKKVPLLLDIFPPECLSNIADKSDKSVISSTSNLGILSSNRSLLKSSGNDNNNRKSNTNNNSKIINNYSKIHSSSLAARSNIAEKKFWKNVNLHKDSLKVMAT